MPHIICIMQLVAIPWAAAEALHVYVAQLADAIIDTQNSSNVFVEPPVHCYAVDLSAAAAAVTQLQCKHMRNTQLSSA